MFMEWGIVQKLEVLDMLSLVDNREVVPILAAVRLDTEVDELVDNDVDVVLVVDETVEVDEIVERVLVLVVCGGSEVTPGSCEQNR